MNSNIDLYRVQMDYLLLFLAQLFTFRNSPYNTLLRFSSSALSWLLIMTLVSLGSSLTFGAMDEKDYGSDLQQIYKIWHDKCNLIVGISQEEINNLRNGIPTENERVQRYVLCLFLVSDALSRDLVINTDIVNHYMPKRMTEQSKKNYFDCIEETKKSGIRVPHLITWNIIECAFKKDPENFIIF
nr:uncharacterized protein LOC111510451 [Leptinotarsa decemlineata]